MIDFYDIPANPVVCVQVNAGNTAQAISGAFTPFPAFAPAVPKAISIAHIAAALEADSRYWLSPATAVALARTSIGSVGGILRGKASNALAPVHFKRVMSELIAAATSLAVAIRPGTVYFCTIQDYNTLVGPINPIGRHWTGNGPDYLLWDSATGNYDYLESKGVSAAPTPTPPKFVEYKTQSENARTSAINPNRHILSYVHVHAGSPVAVRWINSRSSARVRRKGDEQNGLIVAFLQFTAELAHAGLVRRAMGLRNRLAEHFGVAPSSYAGLDADPRLIATGSFSIAETSDSLTLAISRRADRFFGELSRGEWLTNPAKQKSMLIRLRRIQEENQPLQRELESISQYEYVGPISATGVTIVGR